MTSRTNVVEQIRAFRRRLEDGVAEQTVRTTHGEALLCSSIPIVYDAEGNEIPVPENQLPVPANAQVALAS